MAGQRTERLLAFARGLLRADTFAELLRVTRVEVRESIGYNSVWFMIGEKEDPDELQLVEFEGAHNDNVRAVAMRLTVRGDAFLEALIASDTPVVIRDARLDPRTNKAIVEQLQNRTLINIPLRLLEKPFGLFGMGTFGDEGCRSPTDDELDYAVALAGQIAVAASRIMLQESKARDALEMRYRLLFEHINAGLAYHRAIFEGDQPVDYVFLEVNQVFETYTGLKRDAILGKRATQVIPGIRDAKPDLIARYGRVARTGEAMQFDLDFESLGRSYTVNVHSPIPDHFVTVLTDVTEMRDHARELEDINHELEAFSYSISHDLQAPLRSIDGFSQLLLEGYADKLDAVGVGYLERVRAATQRMAKLIGDLLHLSRVTRAQMQWIALNLSELAQAVVSELESAEPKRAVTFEIEPSLYARADPVLMRQLLRNLLGNAFKFTSRHPSARIRFGQEQRGSERVFFVADDGAGFDMAYAGKLFAPFERLHTAEEFSGTGIGLAIVQRIVRRHGGRIWAESAIEKGATFFFTLSGTVATA